jgi:hypothetical protein
VPGARRPALRPGQAPPTTVDADPVVDELAGR